MFLKKGGLVCVCGGGGGCVCGGPVHRIYKRIFNYIFYVYQMLEFQQN